MSIGNIKDYTPNYKFIIPKFDTATWHDYIEANFRSIDALLYNIFVVNGYQGEWTNSTLYEVGSVLFIGDNNGDFTGKMFKVLVEHTTPNIGNFETFYNNNPSYYEQFADFDAAERAAQLAKDWANKMNGTVDGIEYSSKYYATEAASIVTNTANKDLSNLSSTGNDKFVTKNTAQTISGIKTFNVSPLVPTATSGDSSTNAASTEFVTTADNALQTQIDTKANNNAVVHLTDAETITGTKTFSGDGWITYIKNTDVTYNTAPSSDKNSSLVFVDKNNTQMGAVECFRHTDNSTVMQFNVYGANETWSSLPLQLRVEANGTALAYAPSSDATNSIVTTTGINKSADGYVRLGNGIIIQWGSVTLNGQNWVTVTLPTAFTSTNYQVALSCSKVGWQSGVMLQTRNKTTTTFETLGQGSPLSWIAIGY